MTFPNNSHDSHNSHGSSLDTATICTLLSSLVVSYLMEKYKFGTMYYGMLHTVISQLILHGITKNYDSIDTSYFNYVLYPVYAIIVIGIPITIFYFKWKNNKEDKLDFLTIKFYTPEQILSFTNYVLKNSKYYEKMINSNVGDFDTLREYKIHSNNFTDNEIDVMNSFQQAENVKILFNDKYLEIEGYYEWKKNISETKDNDKVKNVVMKYIEINILKKDSVINPKKIIDKINAYTTELNKNNIELKYIKIIPVPGTTSDKLRTNDHSVTFYKGTKRPFAELETKFIKTLFHPERDRLWSVIKNVCINQQSYNNKGQVGRVSLLLYGPPGTGKSTFAYRIAMTLERHIISLDLRNNDKRSLYTVLQKPYGNTSYKDYVYLFEEFDISIKHLYYKDKIISRIGSNYLDDLAEQTYMFQPSYSKKPKANKKKNIDKKDKEDKEDKDENSNNDDDEEEKKPGKNQDKEDVKKEDNKKLTSYLNDDNMHKTNTEFSLRDLLEIFQGPIPFEGMIMLASTNKYDEIKELCPELFRAGRMTPVCFGYIDKVTLQDISKFYFKKKLQNRIPETITIPTSEIIELAFEALHNSDNKGPFEYFSEKLEKLFKKYNL